MILVVVQPEDHGRVSGDAQEKVSIVAEAVVSEHLGLHRQVVVVVHLGVAGGEDVMPEERHLLLEGAPGVYHVVEPLRRSGDGSGAARFGGRDVPEQEVVIGARYAIRRVDQLLDGLLVSLRGAALDFVTGRAEPGASHEVRHQGDVPSVGHWPPPCLHWVWTGS